MLTLHISAGHNLVQAVAAKPSLYSSLSSSITTAGLTNTLSTGTYTLFAPTDTAFTNAASFTSIYNSASQLSTILQYHVVQGIIDVSNLANNTELVTVEGGKLNVMKTATGDYYVNNALVSTLSTVTNGRHSPSCSCFVMLCLS